MGQVARDLLGKPNEDLSTKGELKFGTRGSLSIDLKRGTYFDHEAGEGGGVLDLVMRRRGTDKPGALDWLREREHLPPPSARQEVATYDYTDAADVLLFQVVRYEPKDFRQRRPAGPGKWTWKTAGVPKVLYRLPDVIAAVAAGRTIYIAEGEKGVLALVATGLDATCSPGGAGKWRRDYSPTLAGANVVILPDADEPGRAHAASVSAALAKVAGRVRVLELPGLAEKQDVADWLAAGGTAAELAALAEAASPEAGASGSQGHQDATQAEDASAAVDPDDALARLAELSHVEFARERRKSAAALGMTVRDLDRAVSTLRRRAFQERAAAEQDRQRRVPGAIIWPIGFTMEAHGLVHMGGGDQDLPVTVSGPFEVLGESRTSAGQSWGLWLAWCDRDGRRHEWAMSRRMLMTEPGALEAELSDRGLRIPGTAEARALLRVALAGVETSARVTAVSRTGWHTAAAGAAGYVLADGSTIGSTAEPLVLLQPAEDAPRRVAASGTLAEWRDQVAAPACGNPVAVFCLSAAFAGPLLEPAGESGGGVHLFGPSKRGKTVALQLAASVWGPPDKAGALRDWRSTGNALEAACEEAADGLLSLDEIQQAEPRDVVGAIYGMGNGGGKGRMRADATVRRRRTWRTFFLSNGETDVATIAQKASQRVPPGAEVRLPSIPLPAALWPELHGRPDFPTLCGDLARAAEKQHGTAARAYLDRLAAIRAEAPTTLTDTIARVRDAFLAQQVPAGADPQVRDVARRLALVAAAGEIAAELGVLPWAEGEATAAAAVLFGLWRDRRGGNGSGEDAAHLAQVRLFIIQHGASRMQMIHQNPGGQLEEVIDPARPVINRAGWRKRMDDGTELYLFASDTWRAEVCAGLDGSQVARTLLARGHLERGEGNNLPRQIRIPGVGKPRLYHVRSSILTAEGEP